MVAGKINIVIIDDERRARKAIRVILQNRLSDKVYISAEAEDLKSGLESIQKYKPDILLLDINLGDTTGFDLLDKLETDVKTIFVTAYEQYAIDAFQYSAIDYILKPIDEEKLIKAIESEIRPKEFSEQYHFFKKWMEGEGQSKNKLVLKTAEKIHILNIREIIRCEADINYTRFFLVDNRVLLIARTLKEYELLLSSKGFVRIHRRHLINLEHLTGIKRGKQGYAQMADDSKISISAQKREELMIQVESRYLGGKIVIKD